MIALTVLIVSVVLMYSGLRRAARKNKWDVFVFGLLFYLVAQILR